MFHEKNTYFSKTLVFCKKNSKFACFSVNLIIPPPPQEIGYIFLTQYNIYAQTILYIQGITENPCFFGNSALHSIVKVKITHINQQYFLEENDENGS